MSFSNLQKEGCFIKIKPNQENPGTSTPLLESAGEGSAGTEMTPYYKYTLTDDADYYTREVVAFEDLPKPLQKANFDGEASAYFIVSLSCCGIRKFTADIMSNPGDEQMEQRTGIFDIVNIKPIHKTSRSRHKSSISLSIDANSLSKGFANREGALSEGGTPKHNELKP